MIFFKQTKSVKVFYSIEQNTHQRANSAEKSLSNQVVKMTCSMDVSLPLASASLILA